VKIPNVYGSDAYFAILPMRINNILDTSLPYE
jgi:hypothetical protein